MEHKIFCQADSVLTSAGVHLYNAHQDIRVNDDAAALQLVGGVIEELMNAATLIYGTDPILERIRGKSIIEAVNELPVSNAVKVALRSVAVAPRVSSHGEKMTRAGCQGRY